MISTFVSHNMTYYAIMSSSLTCYVIIMIYQSMICFSWTVILSTQVEIWYKHTKHPTECEQTLYSLHLTWFLLCKYLCFNNSILSSRSESDSLLMLFQNSRRSSPKHSLSDRKWTRPAQSQNKSPPNMSSCRRSSVYLPTQGP